jgi:superfamily II DNA or RNA helicase
VDRMLDLLYHRMTVADSSDTGTGKTATALEVARRFGLPFVVICPKNVKSHWWGWVEEFSRQPDMPRVMGVLGWEEAKLGKSPLVYSDGLWFAGNRDEKYLVIFDEAHRSKSHRTQNARMVRAASEQGIYMVLLSASLIQSCLDLSGLALPLKLIQRQSYWFPFARTFGARLHPRFGGYDDASTRKQQLALGTLLDRVRVRTRREEIAGVLSCINQADLIDSSQLREIRAAYAELDARVNELEALKASALQIVTERLRGRMAIELLKTPLFVEQALEHIEAGNKVALFYNFSESVRATAEALKAASVPYGTITGETPGKNREEAIAGFNAPGLGSLRALVLNIQCGSEGLNLQDTHGNWPRIALLSPPESSSVLVQACGRIGGRIGAKSTGLNRILFVARTVEEQVHKNVRAKIDRLDRLNDSDLQWTTRNSS